MRTVPDASGWGGGDAASARHLIRRRRGFAPARFFALLRERAIATSENRRPSLVRFAWLSIGAAIVVIALKGAAYWVSGSVGLLSDALESLVNLVAAGALLLALRVAERPADEDHPYGHEKVEYFSSGLEGAMIFVAATLIIVTAIERLVNQKPLDAVTIGLAISGGATLINFVVARILLSAGRRRHSIALEADAHHLMTDVWTSIGVLVGVGAVALTGWLWLDAAVALLVAVNILGTGARLVRRSARNLMDAALPESEQAKVTRILDALRSDGLGYHALRTRQAGARRFVELHLLVPGGWSVQHAHDVVEHIEADIRRELQNATVLVHVEPIEDPVSWADVELDRH